MKPILPPRSTGDQSRRYIGLDLAKKETEIYGIDSSGRKILSRRVPTTRTNFTQLASELTPFDSIALESTTNAFAVARIVGASPARVTVSDPIKTRLIAEAKVSTDKIDARVIAELDRADYLPSVWVPDADTEQLRRLMSDRQSLVDRRTELKNRIHAVLHRNLVAYSMSDLFGESGRASLNKASDLDKPDALWDLDPDERFRIREMLQEIDCLDRDIQSIETLIAGFIAARPHLLAAFDLLVSIPGVSLVVAAGLLAAIGDVSRFKSAKRLASYFGLVPSTSQSGTLKFYHGRITKRGRSQGRWLLIEAAQHLVQAPGPMRAFFARIARKRGYNRAIVAVARKLAELVWRLLTKHQEYFYSIPRLTDEKRSRVRQLARKAGVKSRSATPQVGSRSPIYGLGLEGRKIKADLIRQASEHAEQLYARLVGLREEKQPARACDGFDPTRPNAVEWRMVLERFAEAYAKTVGACKSQSSS